MKNPVLDSCSQMDLLSAFTGLASQLKTYYDVLRKSGFSKAEALQITMSYQSDLNKVIMKTSNE